MMNTVVKAVTDLSEEIKSMLTDLEQRVETYTLADAIREGGKHAPGQAEDWAYNTGEVCALSAAAASIKARTE